MEHDLELISPILEIVDRTIHIQSYPRNIGSYDPYFLIILKTFFQKLCCSVGLNLLALLRVPPQASRSKEKV